MMSSYSVMRCIFIIIYTLKNINMNIRLKKQTLRDENTTVHRWSIKANSGKFL